MEFQRILASAAIPLVCVALIAQPIASPVLAAGQQNNPNNELLDGTPVKLRLSQTVSSATAKTGDEVPFEVMDDIEVNGITVLKKGSTAIGTVTEAQPKGHMGRGGKLNMTISYARLIDGEKVTLRAVSDNKGGSHTGAMTGAMVATSLIIWPAAPFFLFMHGKDISIPQGTEITAFIDGDAHLDMSRFSGGSSNGSGTAVASTGQTQITVDSSPSGADIEVDGNFVGSTPSTVPVSNGSHEITVKKSGYSAWTRHMNISGGNLHLEADLSRGR
ncbi:MAG: PEGA domain-containing protein [Acidobacteriota bacterium]